MPRNGRGKWKGIGLIFIRIVHVGGFCVLKSSESIFWFGDPLGDLLLGRERGEVCCGCVVAVLWIGVEDELVMPHFTNGHRENHWGGGRIDSSKEWDSVYLGCVSPLLEVEPSCCGSSFPGRACCGESRQCVSWRHQSVSSWHPTLRCCRLAARTSTLPW